MAKKFAQSWQNQSEDGASAVEYGLLVAAIAALIVLIVFALGGVIKENFDRTCDTIGGAAQVVNGQCDAG